MPRVVIDVAVDKPGAARVLLLTVASVEGRPKKAATSMMAQKERKGLKRTCFQGQYTRTLEVVV